MDYSFNIIHLWIFEALHISFIVDDPYIDGQSVFNSFGAIIRGGWWRIKLYIMDNKEMTRNNNLEATEINNYLRLDKTEYFFN